MPSTDETYLGDSLYVSISHGQIQLRVPTPSGEDYLIFLNAKTLEAFLMWLRALRERAQKEGRSAVE